MDDLVVERRENFLRWMRAMELNANRIHTDTGLPKMTVSDYVTGKSNGMTGANEARIAHHYGYSVDAIFGPHDPDLAERSFVATWRENIGLSVEQVATRTNTTPEIQRLVERGQLPLIGKRRRLLAEALGIPEGFLLIDPALAQNSHLVAAVELPSDQHSAAARVLRALG